MINAWMRDEGLVALRRALGEMGYKTEVRRSPRLTQITAANRYAGDPEDRRFVVDFSPGSTVRVDDVDRSGGMALVTLQEPSRGVEIDLLGQDESALFVQRVPSVVAGLWREPQSAADAPTP